MYSTEQVLDALHTDDDFALAVADEPMMAGSDDDFSDMEVVSDGDDDNDFEDILTARAECSLPPSPVHFPLSPSTQPTAPPTDPVASPLFPTYVV